MQVMIYQRLLQGLADACDAEYSVELLALHRLDGKVQLSKEVSTLLSHSELSKSTNLCFIARINPALGRKVPP